MATHVPTPYTPLPQPGSSYHAHSPRRSIWTAVRITLIACATILIAHGLLQLVAPDHPYTSSVRSAFRPIPPASRPGYSAVDHTWQGGQAGGFYRDPKPIKTILGFWDLAEKELKAKGLDTCWDKLGPRFIEEYHSTEMAYCLPPGTSFEGASNARNESRHSHDNPPTWITCSAIHRSKFTKWWPYPAAPCLSSNMRMIEGQGRAYRAAGCEVTNDGIRLISQMANENFAGKDSVQVKLDSEEGRCEETVDHTVVLIHRQDQWNPFHVAEDLITTVATLLLAARNAPDLIEDRVQLVFSEGFGMDQNHFTPLWDRMGAWAPRRLSLDPWGKGVCLSNAIHSVGAGASFLSAMGVSSSFKCASSITWAASHYYRHLFGLAPLSLSSTPSSDPSAAQRRPINILWLSRAKLDAYALKHDDWSKWRGVRHLVNEPEVLEGIREGIRDFCSTGRCHYEDALEDPESWTDNTLLGLNDSVPIRFTSIDPTVHALETQVHYVGHTSILISLHGGALGLSLFLPPGEATVIELQVKEVSGNFHFEHMAYEMGHVYEQVRITRTVDVDSVVRTVREQLVRLVGQEKIEAASLYQYT